MHPNIIVDSSEYGSRNSVWHPNFVQYMVEIVNHPSYAGMPDAVKFDGKIQWEAPSNRSSGLYQYTHHKRRDWWKEKAISVGINVDLDKWISKTAKLIHPTGIKPCKKCGKSLRIDYCYPNKHLQSRISSIVDSDLLDNLDPIDTLIVKLVSAKGMQIASHFKYLFKTNEISPPELGENIDAWIAWLRDDFIPREPNLLSPGAMSNAPDRFDGFHSFNLCCRGKADTGRHIENLRSYTTDRRVFEYWSDGNWIAADKLMGIVRKDFRNEQGADGGGGPCSADHIGPISLGFSHRPEFRLLSTRANSAKNNRMSYDDVLHLIAVEEETKSSVASWHSQTIWDLKKYSVTNDELALRLSKMMRDHQRQVISYLSEIFNQGHLYYLTSLMNLEYAYCNVKFENLRIENYLTKFDSMSCTPRHTKYAIEQIARRIRIGFNSLGEYLKKQNRHQDNLTSINIDNEFNKALMHLDNIPMGLRAINNELMEASCLQNEEIDTKLRRTIHAFSKNDLKHFHFADNHLTNCIKMVATLRSEMWDSDRYVREEYAFD